MSIFAAQWEALEPVVGNPEGMLHLVMEYGLIPFFSNAIAGFSIQEHTPAEDWWVDDPARDPWAWRQLLAPESADGNGDGIVIEHIYAGTYEGYMMVVEDPSQVYIAVNPHMGSGAEAPELEDYVALHKAAGGINGGGFEDSGGTGNGSIPAGITIIDGKLISGGAPQPIVGITKDHRLITTTCSGQEALDMGVVEAVTFGPTFLTDGVVTYRPGTDNLNMLNPRTAIGQKADGTFLLLVVDGRGPSSFGAKYEDIVKIFQDYGAVNAGNLDGGNSSVMIYNDRYIHYPVSMYDSRSLPSVILVRGKE